MMLDYFQQVFIESLKLLGISVFPLFVLALIMHDVSASIATRLQSIVGRRLYLFLFAWLGTTVHESGHAIFCLLFRHKIRELKFFSPDKKSGKLGYVIHIYNPKSLYQKVGNFFVAIGPIILGTIVIFFISYFLLGLNLSTLAESRSISEFVAQIETIKKPLWSIILFVYIAFSVGSSISLSRADISHISVKGVFFTFTLILLLHFATFWSEKARTLIVGFYHFIAYNLIGIMVIVVSLNIILLLFLRILNILFNLKK